MFKNIIAKHFKLFAKKSFTRVMMIGKRSKFLSQSSAKFYLEKLTLTAFNNSVENEPTR